MATNATHFSSQLICIEYRLNTYEFNGRSFCRYPGVHLQNLITTPNEKRGKENTNQRVMRTANIHIQKQKKMLHSRKRVAFDELSHTHKKHAISLLYKYNVRASVCECGRACVYVRIVVVYLS